MIRRRKNVIVSIWRVVLIYSFSSTLWAGLWASSNPDFASKKETINSFLLAESDLPTKTFGPDHVWSSIKETASDLKYSFYHMNREEGIVVLKIVKYRSQTGLTAGGGRGTLDLLGWPVGPIYFLAIQVKKDHLHFFISSNDYSVRKIAERLLYKFQKEITKRLSNEPVIILPGGFHRK